VDLTSSPKDREGASKDQPSLAGGLLGRGRAGVAVISKALYSNAPRLAPYPSAMQPGVAVQTRPAGQTTQNVTVF